MAVGVKPGLMLERKRVREIMDDPSLDRELHLAALRGLERLNAISNSKNILAAPIIKLLQRLSVDRSFKGPLRVLDIACGAGDMPIELSNFFKDKSLPVEIHGLDISDLAVSYATKKNTEARANCQFSQLNVIEEELPAGFDVVTTSLFTHHLDPPEIEILMQKMARAAGHLMLINDLERSALSLFSVTMATHLLTSSPVVQHDGPASVRAAFTRGEMLCMAIKAGLQGAVIKGCFPCRMLLSWQKETNNDAG